MQPELERQRIWDVDLTIPNDIPGYQLAVQMQTILPNLKIIISSGNYNDENLKQNSQKKKFKILPKPYQLEELKQVLMETKDNSS